MKKNLVVHPQTQLQLRQYIGAPSQAMLLVGPTGSGKASLARFLAEQTLAIEPGTFDTYQYNLSLCPEDGKAIGIDTVRGVERFLSLKVPGKKQAVNRAVLIEDSHLLTPEAQNALLKTLEEPPAGSIILLTTNQEKSLLPTIRSRTQAITVHRPSKAGLRDYFAGEGFADSDITQAYAMSGGLPGLMQALLEEADHPLRSAAQEARQLLSQPLLERLVAADALAKRRQLAVDTVNILQQMAHTALQTATGKAAQRWQNVLRASYDAADALDRSAQLKLVLTDMVLRF